MLMQQTQANNCVCEMMRNSLINLRIKHKKGNYHQSNRWTDSCTLLVFKVNIF